MTGCSSQVCAAGQQITTCEFRPEYACYSDATCERQSGGECGWTSTPELEECLENPLGGGDDDDVGGDDGGDDDADPPAADPPAVDPPTKLNCNVGGCSGQLCSSSSGPIYSTCELRPEYACYRSAICEVQDNGSCGWTSTPALEACLAGGGIAH